MKKISLACLFTLVLAGCSSAPKQQDNYQDASFELCNTEVKVYSVSDDGRVRIVCSDGSKFQLNNEKTLDIMRDINVDYCTGEGLGKFNETSRYYTLKKGNNLRKDRKKEKIEGTMKKSKKNRRG